MTATFPFKNEMPSQEAFDHMSDAGFCDWWDAFIERVQAQATSEDEVDAACAARADAETARGW